MSVRAILLSMLVLCSAIPPSLAQEAGKGGNALTAGDIFRNFSPYLVTVTTQNSDGAPLSQGSGFLLGPKWVVTNLHVMKYAVAASVKVLADGATYSVDEATAFSRKKDLCLLQLSSSASPVGADGELAQWGPIFDPNPINIGDDVLVLGTPKGLEGTLSKGIISGIRSDPKLLQLDAAVSPGSSGGPVLNMRGDVIGVVVSTLIGGQNLNFAVPIEDVLSLEPGSFDIRMIGGLAVFDREQDRLIGPVKKVTSRRVDMMWNTTTHQYEEKPAEKEQSNFYDIAGNKVRWEARVLASGKVTSGCWHYNDDYLVVATSTCSAGSQKPPRSEIMATGTHIFGETTDLGEGLPSGSYSPDGLLKWLSVSGDDGFFEKRFYTYDEEGREIERRIVDKTGRQLRVEKSQYNIDATGNWIVREVSSYSANYPSLGFTPASREYRTITYHN